MSHIEREPGFTRLGKIKGCHKTNPFTEARKTAAEFGLTLERIGGRGVDGAKYSLHGDADLGQGGVYFKKLDEVYEELENYGYEPIQYD